MKILVLGGTRFFGRLLIEKLLEQGHRVTIATRGKTLDPFGERVNRSVVDRFSEVSMSQAFRETQWDAIYDQICYTPNDAKIACDVFAGKTLHYIFTSSMAVYDAFKEEPFLESDFEPYAYPLVENSEREAFSYSEGKRAAEAYFFQKAAFPVTAVRFPIVMGEEDYTERLTFHIERIKEGKAFYIPNEASKMSYISAEEAGDFLAWLAESQLMGPVNACSDGVISIKDMIALIERIVGKEAVLAADKRAEQSPYGYAGTKMMSTEKAKKAGYAFRNLHDWLPSLIEKLK